MIGTGISMVDVWLCIFTVYNRYTRSHEVHIRRSIEIPGYGADELVQAYVSEMDVSRPHWIQAPSQQRQRFWNVRLLTVLMLSYVIGCWSKGFAFDMVYHTSHLNAETQLCAVLFSISNRALMSNQRMNLVYLCVCSRKQLVRRFIMTSFDLIVLTEPAFSVRAVFMSDKWGFSVQNVGCLRLIDMRYWPASSLLCRGNRMNVTTVREWL